MELQPGVFVVKAATDGWEPDPDVPGSEMRELVRADGVWAGLTRFTDVDGPVRWTPERREVVVILEGSVRIEIAGWQRSGAGGGGLVLAAARGGDDLACHDAVQGGLGPG